MENTWNVGKAQIYFTDIPFLYRSRTILYAGPL